MKVIKDIKKEEILSFNVNLDESLLVITTKDNTFLVSFSKNYLETETIGEL